MTSVDITVTVAIDTPEIITCPNCGGEIRVWWTKPELRGSKTVRYQAVSHGLVACEWFRNQEDPDAFSSLAPPV